MSNWAGPPAEVEVSQNDYDNASTTLSAGNKQSIARIAATIYGIGFVASCLMVCAPPACLPLFGGLCLIATALLVLGSRSYRIFGAIALALALVAMIAEYRAGKRLEERWHRLHEQSTGTNAISSTPKK